MTALPEKYVCTKCGSDDIRVEADVVGCQRDHMG
jgi:hypothetical protein